MSSLTLPVFSFSFDGDSKFSDGGKGETEVRKELQVYSGKKKVTVDNPHVPFQ